MRYRREVDGLRALAVLPVIFFHAGLSVFSGGFVGVDVFFVISGYLITSIILDAENSGTFSLKNFYERRARRILPALFLIMSICLAFAWFWLLPSDMQEFSQSLISVSIYISNIFFWRNSGYFDSAVEVKPLIHTWSLGVEEQFYMLFPLLLVFLLRRTGRKSTLALFIVMFFLSLALTAFGAMYFPNAAFYLLPSRAWELLAGSFISLFAPQIFNVASLNVKQIAGILGTALILFAVFVFDKHTPFPSLYTLIPVAGTVLILCFASSETYVGRLLGHRLLVGIGLISYSAYLWHQPLFAFARQRSLLEPAPEVFVALSFISFIAAYLSWRYVETPFRRKGSFSRRQIFAYAITGSSLFLFIGFIGNYTEGFFFRSDYEKNFSDFKQRMRINTGLPNCKEASFTDCATSDAPEILVWGDSYAMHLVQGIISSNPDAKIAQRTMSHCGPILDAAPINEKYGLNWAKDCIAWNDGVLSYLRDTPSIKYVVLGSRFVQYWEDGSHIVDQEGMRQSITAEEMLRLTLKKIGERNIVPIIFSPLPQNGKDMAHCILQAQLLQESDTRCDFPETDAVSFQQQIDGLLRKIDGLAKIVWLKEGLCTNGMCHAKIGDVIIYRDKGHLSYEGSAYLGRTMNFYSLIVSSN